MTRFRINPAQPYYPIIQVLYWIVLWLLAFDSVLFILPFDPPTAQEVLDPVVSHIVFGAVGGTICVALSKIRRLNKQIKLLITATFWPSYWALLALNHLTKGNLQQVTPLWLWFTSAVFIYSAIVSLVGCGLFIVFFPSTRPR